MKTLPNAPPPTQLFKTGRLGTDSLARICPIHSAWGMVKGNVCHSNQRFGFYPVRLAPQAGRGTLLCLALRARPLLASQAYARPHKIFKAPNSNDTAAADGPNHTAAPRCPKLNPKRTLSSPHPAGRQLSQRGAALRGHQRLRD
jgi:hypothetical protein